MTRSTTLWTCLVLAGAGACTAGCKSSSDVSQAQREGGMRDPNGADGGAGGQDGVADESYHPPLVPPHKPPIHSQAGSHSMPVHAGAADTGQVVDPGPVDAGYDAVTKPDEDD